jgi:hypothetical protein
MLRAPQFLGATAVLIWASGLSLAAAQSAIQLAQAELPILPESSEPAAELLEVTADCDAMQPGGATVVFRWAAAPSRDTRQRIDVTKFRNGFESRDLESIAEVPTSQQSLEWRGMEAGVNYYWRVLTLTPDGWVTSAVGRFEAPTCPVDFEESGGAPE